ncbi:hypothetical protein L6452_21364 [Arctium lappa]|uniref:Uncharacterized protein n=1 Tax=Arctium lappa TaxID=4217 RepID=A0ACB9BF85_ARCLA|nr:hypothetical protein L6452_21364 [Arctium lappa]
MLRGGETRCSAVWSAHLFWVQRAIGSNPVTLMFLPPLVRIKMAPLDLVMPSAQNSPDSCLYFYISQGKAYERFRNDTLFRLILSPRMDWNSEKKECLAFPILVQVLARFEEFDDRPSLQKIPELVDSESAGLEESGATRIFNGFESLLIPGGRPNSMEFAISQAFNGKLLAISEAQGSRRKKARQKEGRPRNDPSMLCERVAGNDWAQESSQHSVESGVDLLVPCREREVVRLAAAEAIDLARDAPKKPSLRRPRRPWGNRTREEERKELRLQFRKGRLFPAAEAAYDRLFQNQCEYRRIGDFVAQS